MWLGVVILCLNANATSCDVLINTSDLYLTEEQCWNDAEAISRDLKIELTAYRSNYSCMKFDAGGSPV